MKNRIKSAFDHLTDTDIEKISQLNIDLTAPDGAAGRIEALVMKKIAASPGSNDATIDAATAQIIKKPRSKKVFRRTIVIAAAAVLSLALTFGTAAQTGKIRQIFWFGKDGLESTLIAGTGEDEPIPTGFYLLNEPLTFDSFTLNYAIISPSDDGTCSLRLCIKGKSSRLSAMKFRIYITLPDGSEYEDKYPDRGTKIITCIDSIPSITGEICNFTLHIESGSYSIAEKLSLPAADSTIFNDLVSTYEWNGIIIQALTFPGEFNAVLLRVGFEPDKCTLPELKKIISTAEQKRNEMHITPRVWMYSKDGASPEGTTYGSGRYTDNTLYQAEDENFIPGYLAVRGFIIYCDVPVGTRTFEETYGVDIYKLASEGSEAGFIVVDDNSTTVPVNQTDETYRPVISGNHSLDLYLVSEILIPLKK